MSKKRGNRGRVNKSAVILLKERDATMDLRGCVGDKPHVNDIMPVILSRMDEEERAAMIEMAKRWRNRYGWPPDVLTSSCMGEPYPGYDDDEDVYDYDEYEELCSVLGDGSSRRGKKLTKKDFKRHGRKGKSRGSEEDDYWKYRGSMFNNGEWSDDLDDEDNYEPVTKSIKFYPDIENELNVKEFKSLKSFNDFCGERGYLVSTVDYDHLVNWDVVHCCLDPISLEYGESEVITDNSYGGLYWTVNESVTKDSNSNVNDIF